METKTIDEQLRAAAAEKLKLDIHNEMKPLRSRFYHLEVKPIRLPRDAAPTFSQVLDALEQEAVSYHIRAAEQAEVDKFVRDYDLFKSRATRPETTSE